VCTLSIFEYRDAYTWLIASLFTGWFLDHESMVFSAGPLQISSAPRYRHPGLSKLSRVLSVASKCSPKWSQLARHCVLASAFSPQDFYLGRV
jgi:hypothetical protein